MKLVNLIRQNKNLLPLLVLIIFCISTIYQVLTYSEIYNGETSAYYFSPNHYLAFGVVILDLIIYFKWRKAFKIAIITTIVLGLLNILNFTYFERTYSIKFIISSPNFQPLSFLIGITYYILNFNYVNQIILSNLFSKASESEIKQRQRELIEKYKSNLATNTNNNLQAIIEQKGMVEEARIAAEELMNERTSIRTNS